MRQCKSTTQLKSLAREQLSGNYTIAIIALCITSFISLILTFLIESFTNTNSIMGLLLYYLVTALLQIFMGIFMVGHARLYLNITCKRSPLITDVFYGFTKHTDKAIIFSGICLLASTIFMIPAFIFIMISIFTGSIIFMLLSTISMILGMVGLTIFYLTYSQCYYSMVDLPNYSISQIMKTSALIMKGHRLHLFYLQVSFIGLILLGFLTCFISMLWVSPYLETTLANFYLDLMNVHSTNQSEAS